MTCSVCRGNPQLGLIASTLHGCVRLPLLLLFPLPLLLRLLALFSFAKVKLLLVIINDCLQSCVPIPARLHSKGRTAEHPFYGTVQEELGSEGWQLHGALNYCDIFLLKFLLPADFVCLFHALQMKPCKIPTCFVQAPGAAGCVGWLLPVILQLGTSACPLVPSCLSCRDEQCLGWLK